ncbi:MAG: protein kinase [Minicystis sp.]
MPRDLDSAPDSALPETIGPYRIHRALGRGGMGVVYRAEHRDTGERVALKTVRLADQAMLSSMRREIHALRQLQHPGVVRIVAEGVDDGLPWYAMELLQGKTLHDHNAVQWRGGATDGLTTTMAAPDAATAELPGSGPVSTPGAERDSDSGPISRGPRAAGGSLQGTLTLVRGVCDTLAFVHGMGLVHRDLKPDNVFIRDDGTPVLVDFGLALAASGARGHDRLEVTGRPMGSPAYMSPEQIRGELLDARADLYALGCMLYESVTGRVPFEGTVQMVIAQHIHKLPQPPSELVAGLPAALEQLILALLQKRPQDRIGYADDVAVALAALGAEGQRDWPRGRPYLYRPGLAGRGNALADVMLALNRTQEHKGARIFVGGESGVGKTRFAMEIATLATRRGLRVVAGECAAISAGDDRDEVRAAPMHPFRPLLLSIADRCRELGAEETARLLGDRGPVLAAYEPSLRSLPGQDRQPELAPLQAQAARARLVSALAETLAALGKAEPILLLVDDLQWADENSMACLKALDAAFSERAAVVLVGTYRTEEANDAIRELSGAEGALAIELGRLDAAAVGRMVSDMLAMPSPPASFIDFLLEQSEGNPFFIAEYLRVAIDERVLARNERGEWRLAEEGAARESFREILPLPRELSALVGRRVSALGTGARALARVASVLGREFDADVLAAATTLDEIPGLEAIEELRARQILDVAGERLRFAHDKLREIIFADISEAERRALSGVAARAIEARYGETPEIAGYYPILAHHFAAAGDDAKAIEYLEKAGGRALETGASAEALGFFRRAIELDDQRRSRGDEPVDTIRRACWERRLGQAEFNLGHMREAERLTRSALYRLRTGRAPSGPLGKQSTVIGLVVLVTHLLRQLYHLFGPARRPTSDPGARRRLTEASLAAERLSEILLLPERAHPLVQRRAAVGEPRGGPRPLARAGAQLRDPERRLRPGPVAARRRRVRGAGPRGGRRDRRSGGHLVGLLPRRPLGDRHGALGRGARGARSQPRDRPRGAGSPPLRGVPRAPRQPRLDDRPRRRRHPQLRRARRVREEERQPPGRGVGAARAQRVLRLPRPGGGSARADGAGRPDHGPRQQRRVGACQPRRGGARPPHARRSRARPADRGRHARADGAPLAVGVPPRLRLRGHLRGPLRPLSRRAQRRRARGPRPLGEERLPRAPRLRAHLPHRPGRRAPLPGRVGRARRRSRGRGAILHAQPRRGGAARHAARRGPRLLRAGPLPPGLRSAPRRVPRSRPRDLRSPRCALVARPRHGRARRRRAAAPRRLTRSRAGA